MLVRMLGSLLKKTRRHRNARRYRPCPFQPLEPRLLLSTVTGRVWLDANINGIQDPGESDLSGVTVVLYNQGGAQQASVNTGSNGVFTFNTVTSGTYYLQFETSQNIASVDHQLTYQSATFGGLSLPTLDSDALTNTGKTANFTVDGTTNKTDLAAGYAPIFTLTSNIEVGIGQALDFAALFASTGYQSNYAATLDWGDSSDEDVVTPTDPTINGQLGDLQLVFDFDSYDKYGDIYENDSYETGFFSLTLPNGQLRRDLLQYAAVTIASRFGDTLSSITPEGSNTWSQVFFAPDTDDTTTIANETIATNELKFYAGGRLLNSGTLGEGGPGGFTLSATSQSFFDSVIARGQAGALGDDASKTDFSLWGGAITFDLDSNWYFGIDDDEQGFSQSDFLSVAMHEMAHALGFGTADSWDNLVSAGTFNGTEATTVYGSNPPVHAASLAHFDFSTIDPVSSQEAAMDPNITNGTRKYFTALDFAVMDDIGWDLLNTFDISEDGLVEGTHTYDTAGTYTVTVYLLNSDGGLATYTTEITVLSAITVVDVQVNAAGFDTDDGSLVNPSFSQSIQRSILQSVVVEFSRAVNDLSTTDIQLKLIDVDGTTYEPSMSGASFSSADGNVTIVIDLTGLTIEDGVYELLIYNTVTDLATNAGLESQYQSTRFHQLGGDFNGDARFDIADMAALQHYWNGRTANPPSYIDVTGDDTVDGDDLANFGVWMSRLDLNVIEQVQQIQSLAVDPPTPSANMAMALAAYQSKQATLSVVNHVNQTGDDVVYEDLIGQWLL